MGIVYAWLWSYWGLLVFGVVMGFLVGSVGVLKQGREKDVGLTVVGFIVMLRTVLYGILWAIIGPFSIHWILVPGGIFGVIMLISAKRELVRGGVLLSLAVGVVYSAAFNDTLHAALAPRPAPPPEGGVRFTKGKDGWWHIAKADGGINGSGGALPREQVRDFWPAQVVTSQGLLKTPGGAALRLLASGYLTPLFDSPKTEFPGGVVGVMKPYRAYYVVRKQDAALQVAEPPYSAQSALFWVRQSDCYVWTTGQAADLRGKISVYGSEGQARTATQPLTPPEKYTDFSRLAGTSGASGSPPMSRLPVLLQSGDVTALLCPAYGGQLCWVNTQRAAGSMVVSNTE